MAAAKRAAYQDKACYRQEVVDAWRAEAAFLRSETKRGVQDPNVVFERNGLALILADFAACVHPRQMLYRLIQLATVHNLTVPADWKQRDDGLVPWRVPLLFPE